MRHSPEASPWRYGAAGESTRTNVESNVTQRSTVWLLVGSVILVTVLAACSGGSNLPTVSRTISTPAAPQSSAPSLGPTPSATRTLPTRTSSTQTTSTTTETSTRTQTSTETSTETSTQTSTETSTATKTRTHTNTVTSTPTSATSPAAAPSSAAAESSGTPLWPWLLLVLIAAVVVALVLRARSSRAAGAETHRNAVAAYTEGIALHDQAAVLPMSADVDRPRLLGNLSATLDRTAARFDALAAEPALHEAAAELGDVRLALGNLRGALSAQVAAGTVDAELLRERLAALDTSLQRFRNRIEPPAG